MMQSQYVTHHWVDWLDDQGSPLRDESSPGQGGGTHACTCMQCSNWHLVTFSFQGAGRALRETGGQMGVEHVAMTTARTRELTL